MRSSFYTFPEAEDVGVWSAGAKREERQSYLQCSLVGTGWDCFPVA